MSTRNYALSAVFGSLTLALAVPAEAFPTLPSAVANYIKKGLVGHWDGEYNATNSLGELCHDSTPGVEWFDLSGQGQHAKAVAENGVYPRWGENFMNPSNTVNGATTIKSYYSFTPSAACLAGANCDTGGFTYQVCAQQMSRPFEKEGDAHGDMTLFGFTQGAEWYARCDYRRGGSPAFLNVRSSGESDFAPNCIQWNYGCVDSFGWGRGLAFRHFVNENYDNYYEDKTYTLGSARVTGGGKIGSRTSSNSNYYEVRLYDRELNRVEAAYNAAIDRNRFLGAALRETRYVGAYSMTNENYGTSSPAYKSLVSVSRGGQQTFSLTGVAAHPFDQKPAYAISSVARALYHGFTLTTIDSTGVETDTDYGAADTTVSVAVNDDTFVTWKWERQYAIVALAGKGGKVLVAGTAEAVAGYTNWHNAYPRTSVTVTAVPDENFTFNGWEGDVTGDPTKAETTVTLDQGRTISCTFVRGGKGDGSTYCWTGSSSTSWNDGSNWDRGFAPLEGDCVVITSSVAQTILLNAPTPRLKSLVLGGGPKTSTITMQNWETTLEADAIVITNNGVVTTTGAFDETMMSNRVNLVCGNLTLDAGGKIDVNGLGYSHFTAFSWSHAGHGPGAGATGGGGAGHGGRAGMYYNSGNGGKMNDSLTAPVFPGSSGGGGGSAKGGNGGGAVRIAATGHVAVYGTISANGVKSSNCRAGSGAGGSVYITCNTFDGTNVISALGCGSASDSGCKESGGGGGGRIAIVYDAAAQAAAKLQPTPLLQAGSERRGNANLIPAQYPSHGVASLWAQVAQPGTVYLTDNSFYPGTMWMEWSGYVTAPGSAGSVINLDTLIFSNEAVDNNLNGRRPILCDATVTIPGEVRIEGGTALVFSNCTVSVGSLTVTNGYFELLGHSTLTVAGDLTLAGSGAVTFGSGPTNGVGAATWSEFGQRIAVGGNIVVKDTATLYVMSDRCTGGSPYFTAKNLTVTENATISGYARGWGYDDLWKIGSGGPSFRTDKFCGAAYGGAGGGGSVKNTRTYGDPLNPTDPGSTGSSSLSAAGWGGGLFRATIDRTVTLDGTINMDGGYTRGGNNCRMYGGGSGGAVNLRCVTLRGAGTITAKGGGAGTDGSAKTESGCGGGGRIFVHCRTAKGWTGTLSAASGENGNEYAYTSEDGTAILKPAGGLVLLLR